MSSHLECGRRRVGFGMIATFLLVALWCWSPGLPVLWAPNASAAAKAAGEMLFEHEWTANDPLAHGDGLGPVFNATSCVACHFQGGVGGGGPNQNNVVAFEVAATKNHPEIRNGLIHHFSVADDLQESAEKLQQLFPAPSRTESINSTALFGIGWIDRISEQSIRSNRNRKAVEKVAKELNLEFNGVAPGRLRVLADGRVGKFGWRGQFASLTDFTAAACANELGLGNPLAQQPKPLGRPDYPASKPDLDGKQFADLVAFIDTLPRPIEVLPQDNAERKSAERGKELFRTVGCAICHVPDLGGVQGIYTDFLLYELDDPAPPGTTGGYYDRGLFPPPPSSPAPLPLPDDQPRPSEWKTPALWGVADSAPYFHDGGSPTLESAILRHQGDAKSVTHQYKELPQTDRQAVISFLETLKAPPSAKRPRF
jgi:CxxC motif-containing protein (DUF1111 family)